MLLLSLSEKESLKTDAVNWLNGIEGINTAERKRAEKESFVPTGERVARVLSDKRLTARRGCASGEGFFVAKGVTPVMVSRIF